jgi:hypothetical protein
VWSGRPPRSRSNARSAAELARLLGDGVPHALKSFRPATLPWSAWLRSTRSPPTPPRCEADAGAENILRVLDACAPPPAFLGLDAAGVFAGYLVLDAWVANQDRHDRNWAVLERADAPDARHLAPSFDHTSSLGFNLVDARRKRVLAEPGGIKTWVMKGRASQFEHPCI